MAEIEDLKIVGGSTYTVGNQDIIANEWEAGKTYVKGKSYVTYEHGLYVCNTTHTSVSPIDLTKWTAITVGEAIAANTTAIGSLSTLTTTVKSSLVGAVNSINRIGTKSITISITCRGYIRCYQMGKIVFVDININTDGNTTPVNTTIATGFPKPYESFYPRLLARDNNGTYAQVLNFDKNNGTIKTADTVMQGNTWWGCQFTYFTND